MQKAELCKLSEQKLAPVIGVSNDTTWLRTLYLQNKDTINALKICISIVIPYYKRPTTLAQTLNSLVRNRFDKTCLEILIVDDGSPSELRPDISPYIKKGFDVKYVWQNDEGYRLSAARNLGIRAAKYDNIIILDCDLAVQSNFIEAHAWVLKTSTNVISIGLRDSHEVASETNPSEFLNRDPSTIGVFKKSDWRLTTWINKIKHVEFSDSCWRLCSGGNIAFNRNILQKCGFFSEEFNFWGGEDLEWAYRAYKEGFYFYINNEAKAYHFECRNEEFQTDRQAEDEKKKNLLRDLVPTYNNMESHPGRIPYVSVFITCYNKAAYILEAVKSIAAATKFRHEVVIVDDGSTDDIEAKIASIDKHNLQEIVFVKRRHLGIERTYKDCLSMCRGEFIAQLDADDILLPNAIDTLILQIKDKPVDVAYGKYSRFTDSSSTQNLPTHSWTYPVCLRFLSMFKGMYTHPLRLFKKRALQRVSGLRQLKIDSAVDFSLYSLLYMAAYGVFIDTETYRYRQTPNSVSNSKAEAQALSTKLVIQDTLRQMLPSEGFLVKESSPKQFDIEIEADAVCVFLEHLGIKDSDLQNALRKLVYDLPMFCIHESFKDLNKLQNYVDVSVQELHTQKQVRARLTFEEFQTLAKDLKAANATLKFAPSILEYKV